MSNEKLKVEIDKFAKLDKEGKLGIERYEAQEYLTEYWKRFQGKITPDSKGILKEFVIDLGDVILSRCKYTVDIWKTTKMINELLQCNIKNAILELDSTGIVMLIEKAQKAGVVYGGYIYEALGANLGVNLEIYKDQIEKYVAGISKPIENTLPGWKLIEANITYYKQYGKHLPGVKFDDKGWIIEWIKNSIDNIGEVIK